MTEHAAESVVELPFAHAVGVTDAQQVLLTEGEVAAVHPLASVSKPITALGVLVAVAHGYLDLDEPAGPEGSTVRHLLAHAAGYAFDEERELSAPGRRRMYSNAGFAVLGRHLELATGFEVSEWLEQQVAQPLGLQDVDLDGAPGAGFHGSVRDLLAIGRELLRPRLIPEELWREATGVQFPGLAGLLPGYGKQDPNDWGLGVEIRGGKSPHWTGSGNSPRTFGHFGQSGSFLWVDPEAGIAAAFLGTEPFGPAHVEAWPRLSDTILERCASRGSEG